MPENAIDSGKSLALNCLPGSLIDKWPIVRNILKEKLRRNEVTFGAELSINHPDIAEMIASIGFDWVFIDMQHSPLAIGDVQSMLQVMSYSETVPIVRTAWKDRPMIQHVVDVGAYGLVVPFVESREEMEEIVSFARFPPKGTRSFGPRRAALRDGDYVRTVEKELFIAPMIETEKAIRNLDEILSVEGVDGCMIGPNDLSLSLGISTPRADSPSEDKLKLQEAIKEILRASTRRGLPVGILGVPYDVGTMLEQGFKMIGVVGIDLWFLRDAYVKALEQAKEKYASLRKR